MSGDRPFVDRPVADLVAATTLAERVARDRGASPPTLMRTGMNALFATDHMVIRVGRPSARPELALALAVALTEVGLRVPVPASAAAVTTADGLAATCWLRVEAVEDPIDWNAVGAMVRRVHAIDRDELPAEYPMPSPASFPWWHFERLVEELRDEIDAKPMASLVATIERHRGWDEMADEALVVCHGDVHPGNVLMSADGPVLLDWDLMCRAPAGWDHAMLVTLADRWGGDPAVYRDFADGYGTNLAADPVTRRFADLRNVAATLIRVRAGRTDPAAAKEAERRLRYWRGDADAPQWAAQ